MERKINVLIVDDEGPDRELLKSLITSYCPHLRVVGEAASVAAAENLIIQHQPKAVFLDIQMHAHLGFELLDRFPQRTFLAIMTTGYDQYGIKAVKAGAFDYLLKPIDVDELMEAEQKIRTEINRLESPSEEVLSVFDQGEQVLIKPSEIIYLKAQGSYTLIILAQREILTAKNLNEMMKEFQSNHLVRIHRSYVINRDYMKSYQPLGNEGLITLSNGTQLRVSRTYKKLLKSVLL
ncbi:MAG: LytR/AlgR family response regulator transcription factor [Cyclobacteriaceae bacterium]